MTKTKEVLEHIVEVLFQKGTLSEGFIKEIDYDWFLLTKVMESIDRIPKDLFNHGVEIDSDELKYLISIFVNVYPNRLCLGLNGLDLTFEIGDQSMSLTQVLTGKGIIEEAMARHIIMHYNAWKSDDLKGLLANIESELNGFFNSSLVIGEKAFIKSHAYLRELANELGVGYSQIIKLLSYRKERIQDEMVNNIFKLDAKIDHLLKEDPKAAPYSEKKAVMMKHILSGGDELESLEDLFQYKCDFSLS